MSKRRRAPGHPGAGPHWESARKTAVGRACNFRSRAWFTLGEGILNEIYYPSPDDPCTKDAGFIVTDGREFFSEERVDTISQVQWSSPQVPACTLINTHRGNRYRIRKEIIADPNRDTILQRATFEPLAGDPASCHLYFLIAPHLGDRGIHNTASLGLYKGVPMLFAESNGIAIAVACSPDWQDRSVGFVGASDGWQDLSRHKKMQWHYDLAEDGNVALIGEVPATSHKSFLVSIGFGQSKDEAGYQTLASLRHDFDQLQKLYIDEWENWHQTLRLPKAKSSPGIAPQSAVVLRTHEAVDQPGARMASLSIPWGEVQKQEWSAGYHAVWARDCAQSALGLLACGARADVLRTLDYFSIVQEIQGNWPQLMWAHGGEFWSGIQIDSIAAPILLYEIARQEELYLDTDPSMKSRHATMVRKAAAYIARNGPITPQDRWERNGGFSPYTLATATAALLIASHAARETNVPGLASYLEETADAWNAQIETWTYCPGGTLAKQCGQPGLYCRIVPTDERGRPQFQGSVSLETSMVRKSAPADEMASPDVWQLVRMGLRPPADPRIAGTTAVIDATLKTVTPRGPVWHRYNNDCYGEKPDGSPFAKQGVGRGWPLLSGERAHYELARGNSAEAENLAQSIAAFSNDIGLIPEQVWDTHDIPEKQLHLGHATGSARPLAWAHSEYLQLLRSLADGKIFACPQLVARRYAEKKTPPRHTIWRPHLQTPHLIPGTILRLENQEPFHLEWTTSLGRQQIDSHPSPIGLHFADLPTQKLEFGKIVLSLQTQDGTKIHSTLEITSSARSTPAPPRIADPGARASS